MTKPIFGFEDAREVISSRDQPCADASRSPLKLSFAEDLAALSAILKASPGYGKRSNINVEPERDPEEDPDDYEPTADELMRSECTWSV